MISQTVRIGPDSELRIQVDEEGSEYPGIFAVFSYKGEELGHVSIEWNEDVVGFYLGEPNSETDEATYSRKYTRDELDQIVKEIST